MRRYILAGVFLAALLPFLFSCSTEPVQKAAFEPAAQTVFQQPPEESYQISETKPDAGQIADGRLVLRSSGTYSGLYPEDGSDEQVQSVAAILVENVCGQACQYCQMHFLIGSYEASFTLSELPAGACAWVLEDGRLQISGSETFAFSDELCAFREEESLAQISCTPGEGSLTVTNDSDTEYSDLFIYYKLCGEDGAFLGGICYRVSAGPLSPGETKTVTAGHFYENACEVVGIYTS